MEHLTYVFKGGTHTLPRAADVVGVVGSGNLEVLIEAASLDGDCSIEIATAAVGFGAIWEAVMTDFQARWQLADAAIDPIDFPVAPAKVVPIVLERAGITSDQVKVWEFNEAFAAVVIANGKVSIISKTSTTQRVWNYLTI